MMHVPISKLLALIAVAAIEEPVSPTPPAVEPPRAVEPPAAVEPPRAVEPPAAVEPPPVSPLPQAAAPPSSSAPPSVPAAVEAPSRFNPEPSAASTAAAKRLGDNPPSYVVVPFDIGLVPGLSINGRHRDKRILNKFSVGLLWTRSARVEGVALGMGATVVDEQMQGVAASLAANINRGVHRGVQLTHGYNWASQLRGVQYGSINNAGSVRGVQVGLINVGGSVRGAQIGLINWARSADVSIGLLPITKRGGVRVEVSTSDAALLNVGLRLPAKYTYAFVAAGLHPFGTERGHVGTEKQRGKAWEFGVGFGGHIPVDDRFFIDVDVSGWGVTSGLRAGAPLGAMSKFRLMLGWQAAKRVAGFGGPTLTVLTDRIANTVPILAAGDGRDRFGEVDRPGYGWVSYAHRFGNGIRLRAWPGFVAGLRF